MLEDNAAAAARVKPLIVRPTEFLQLDIGGGSNTLNAMFRKPDVYHVGIAVVPQPQPQYYIADHGLREGKGSTVHVRMLIARYLVEHLPPGPR